MYLLKLELLVLVLRCLLVKGRIACYGVVFPWSGALYVVIVTLDGTLNHFNCN
jgi:hypothetical protein